MPYKGELVDSFACGIILFILKSKNPPWKQAAPNDPWFNLFVTNNAMFWQQHGRFTGPGFYDSDFMDLFNGICAYEPESRYNVNKCLDHPWLKGIAQFSEVLQEMNERKQAVGVPDIP